MQVCPVQAEVNMVRDSRLGAEKAVAVSQSDVNGGHMHLRQWDHLASLQAAEDWPKY